MIATTHTDSLGSSLEQLSVEAAFTLTFLLGSASLVAMSLGDPELLALVAVTGAAVTLLTLAALSAGVRTDGLRTAVPASL